MFSLKSSVGSIRRTVNKLSDAKTIARLASSSNDKGHDVDRDIVESKETLPKGESDSPKQLQKFVLPDETPEVPKEQVFQQISKVRLTGTVYTLEDAARWVNPDSFGAYYKYPALSQQLGNLEYHMRSYDNEYSMVTQFPDITDFVIVGSGLVGSATAYYMKRTASRVADIVCTDRAPYSPHNCTAFCNGLISAQSKSRDLSRIATLTKELIRSLRQDVLVTKEDFKQIRYRPCTHLILWPSQEVDEVMNAVSTQMEDGLYTEAKLPDELEATFPFLKATGTDIALGTHGNQDEALIDPIGLRNLYRTLAQAHGVAFVQGEAIDFNTRYHVAKREIDPGSVAALVVRLASGELKSCNYAKSLLCLGHNTPFLEHKADMEDYMRDQFEDLHFLQPRMRLCIMFYSTNTPVINFPVITDVDGTTLIRENHAGAFKYYMTLSESQVFFEDEPEKYLHNEYDETYPNLYHNEVKFKNYFEGVIKPRLVKRIPAMEDAQFIVAQSGFESCNIYDDNPVIGCHPFHGKVLVSGGYGNRMANFGPAAGIALAELMLLDTEETFDMTNLYWQRVFGHRRVDEFKSILGI